MSSSERTPTPWRRGLYGGVYPLDGGPMIVSGQTKSGYLPNHVENETFIVRAANSHEALMEFWDASEAIYQVGLLSATAEQHERLRVARFNAGSALSQAKSDGGDDV